MRALGALIGTTIFGVLIGWSSPAQSDGFELQIPDGLTEGLEGLMEDMIRDLGPALEKAIGAIEELDAYHPPEILPNGDIILRRKVPDGDDDVFPLPGPSNDDEKAIWL